jgi:hypothetical protein
MRRYVVTSRSPGEADNAQREPPGYGTVQWRRTTSMVNKKSTRCVKYFPLVWAVLWRKPAEAILIWLAVTVSFTLFGCMVGIHATYDRLIENSRMDRLYVNARFPNASPMGILLPFALRDAR